MKLSIAAAIGLLALTMTEAVKVNPLPKPVTMVWGKSGPIKVDNHFRIVGPNDKILSKAMARTAALIKEERWIPQTWEQPFPEFPPFPQLEKRGDDDEETPEFEAFHHGNNKKTIRKFTVEVANLKTELQMGVDESYTLDITASGEGKITAKTTWGALHGLNTLAQIIIDDGRNGLLIEEPVHIVDAPRYTHRGIMYDTARNFYTVKSLLKQIDAMAWSKLNVFHWHLTDTQSWPIEIKKHPKMTRDAYSPREVYKQKDIARVIEYGRERGVRVMAELDLPGHSASGWLQVDKKAVTCADSWWDNDGWTHHSAVQPNPGQLDISYEGTYSLIKDVYDEVANVFTDNVIHVGGDELVPYCYNYSSSAMDWFKQRPEATYSDFIQYYLDKAIPIFQDKPNRRLMMWEDILLSHTMPAHQLPKDVIMQAWNGGVDHIKALIDHGHDVIVTSNAWFYLDCGNGGYVTNDPRYNVNEEPKVPKAVQDALDANPGSGIITASNNWGGPGASWCAPYKSWQRIYSYDFTKGLTAEEAKHVLGGEVAMWSEQSDHTVIENKIWPRAAAFAELMWSGNRDENGFKRTTELSARIQDYRERLVARGHNAHPMVPKYCLQHPHHCDFFRNQTAFGK